MQARSSDDDQGAAAWRRARPRRGVARQAMPLGSRLASPDTVPHIYG